jgi:hypothetical protein
MFRLGKILFLLISVMMINGCKKDPKIENSVLSASQSLGFNCGRVSFLDTISVTLNSPSKISASISGSNNIYVATPGSTSLEIVKMDCDANFIWKKNYNYGSEKVVSVSALGKYDDFYVLTATDNFTLSNGVDTVKAWVSYSENNSSTTINCDRGVSAYNFNPKFITDQSVITLPNYSRLYKYDGSGNLQWQKNLNGNYYDNYNSAGLSADTSNNVYVLTAEKKTYAPFEVFTFTTSPYPSYAVPLDSNGFTITKIDPYGNQVSSKSINKVYANYAGIFNPALSVSANQVNVICDRDVYVFDMSLGSFIKTSPVSNNCVNKIMFPLNNPSIPNTVFHLSYYDGLNTTLLFETWNGASKVNSTIYSDQANIVGLPCMDNNNNIYFARPYFIEKYNAYGNKLYHKSIPISPFTITCLASKLDQVFMIDYESSGRLYIVKPDVNGNF